MLGKHSTLKKKQEDEEEEEEEVEEKRKKGDGSASRDSWRLSRAKEKKI